jgi:hypothetical protein
MTENVQYELSLKDMLTGKLHEADGAAHKLEGTLHHVGERIAHVAEAFGISFALFKGIEFIHQGIEEFDKLEQVQAKVEANLTATAEAAGLTASALSGMAATMETKVHASISEITDMQSQLLTFPAITADVFQQSMGLVADIAKQTNHGLSETAIMYGKALNDPTKGLQKMMRYGVMFTDQEKEKITALQESGHLIEAQKFMMDAIAHSGYGGVAEKMFEADPLARFNKIMMEIKLEIGEAATKLLRFLTPALEGFVGAVKSSIHWIKEHKDLLYALAVGVSVGATIWGVYALAANAATITTTILTAAQAALNFVMSINPISLVIAAISALAAVVVYCYHHFETFHAILWAVWGTIKEFSSIVGDIFIGLWHTMHGVFTFDSNEISAGFNQAAGALFNSAQRLGQAAKDGYSSGIADFAKDKLAETSAAPGEKKKAGKGMAGAQQDAQETKGAKGAKNLNITVNIGSLVKDFRITTQNLMESSKAIKEKITEALTDALNDSQHVAGA